MNLVFTLLATEKYLSKEQIRDTIVEYGEINDLAFERAFERDKNELRDLGIEIELGSFDPFEQIQGYRIVRSEAELPQIDLSVEEAAVIGLAAQLWDHAGMTAEVTTALAKLKSIGNDINPSVLRMTEPRLSAEEPAFDAVFAATSKQIRIEFDYQTRAGGHGVRQLEPWAMVSYRDRWYVGGFDLDRGAPRLFRLSRVQGQVKFISEPGAFEVPQDAAIGQLAHELHPKEANQTAVLRIAKAKAQSLRRHALTVAPADTGFEEVQVAFGVLGDLADQIVSYGPDVTVIGPEELRNAVVQRLQTIVENAK